MFWSNGQGLVPSLGQIASSTDNQGTRIIAEGAKTTQNEHTREDFSFFGKRKKNLKNGFQVFNNVEEGLLVR